MKRPRGLRARLAVAFAGAVAAAVLVFAGVVVAVVGYDEAAEAAAAPQNEEADGAVERVLFAIALASPMVLFGAVALGLSLARTALAPMRDASQRARAARASELDLKLPVGESGDEWDELANTLNSLLADARTSMVRIKQFTADAAHELKTPLTALMGLAEVAVRRERSGEEYREVLNEIREEAASLARLVDALLTLSRADAGTLLPSTQPVDLVQVARAAVRRSDALQKASAPVNLKLEVEVAPVQGDPVLLARVLDNLLENAFRHGAAPVELRLARLDGDFVLEVTDGGRGVPPEFAARLFERFARADGARGGDGHGLGLAIARAIAAAHGGTVALGPSLTPSSFRLTLPHSLVRPLLKSSVQEA